MLPLSQQLCGTLICSELQTAEPQTANKAFLKPQSSANNGVVKTTLAANKLKLWVFRNFGDQALTTRLTHNYRLHAVTTGHNAWLKRVTQGINVCATDSFQVTGNFFDIPIPPLNQDKFFNYRLFKTLSDFNSWIATNNSICLNIFCND